MRKIIFWMLFFLNGNLLSAEGAKLAGGELGSGQKRNTTPALRYESRTLFGVKTNFAFAGLNYTNSQNKKLDYSAPLAVGTGISVALKRRLMLFEMGLSYMQVNSTYKTTGITSTISLDQLSLECIPSVLFFNGPARIKLGSGLSGAYFLKGTQQNNGNTYDLLESTYKPYAISSVSELGLVLVPRRYFMIQVLGFYSLGLSNFEVKQEQSSKINGYGISTVLSVSF